jgi:hypothetical protein
MVWISMLNYEVIEEEVFKYVKVILRSPKYLSGSGLEDRTRIEASKISRRIVKK